ncbi:glutathione S-transferase theta-3-like [Apis dorsata]|uniref:glutathione S-transferase theta-3-like n=1 Tax=Apis dorsata TaxID=7462 RepID=UPI0003DF502C|nr:glutathione S-transferase theta-3-like [Apis dorsata]
MSLKLYYDLLSQPSRTLYIFLKICDIPFEAKLINLAKGEQFISKYQNIHPFQKVPAIEHNGFNMIESVAILRYICREFKVADHWYPKDSKLQLRVDEYLEWHHLNTRQHCSMYFFMKYLMPKLSGQPVTQEKIMKYEKNMIEILNVLENVWLKDKIFLTGSEISIADILGACEVEQVRIVGYNPQENRPRIAAWMKCVENKTSPYYQEAHIFLNKLATKTKEDALKSKI